MAFSLLPECQFVVSGNLVRDTVVRGVDQIQYGATLWVDSVRQSIGGNGANTAYTLGTLGAPVTLVSACGDDAPGDICVRESTALTIALVNSQGERAFLHQPGVNRKALASAIEFAPLRREDRKPWHYHLANPFALPAFRAHAAASLERARELGGTTSLDTGWDSKGRWLEDLGACLPLLDILFVNDREAGHLSGKTDPREMVSALHDLGARRVVLKLGEQGCLMSDEDGCVPVPAFQVPVADTTGAGDTFAGGMLAALRQGLELRDAARFACAVAGLSVQQPGAVAGLRSFPETLAWIEQQQDLRSTT
jgi:sugar/nucleoside kinase (ribokinase family)